MTFSLAAQPQVVSLRRIFPSASFVGCGDLRITAAADHSRHCRPGSLFAVVHGLQSDGLEHLPEAIQNGASSLLVDRPLCDVSLPQCVVPDVRRAFAELCAAMYGYPSRQLGLVGVTGTNGKTTTTWLMRSILQAAGKQAGLLGTIEYSDGIDIRPASLTTPGSAQLSQWLGSMVRRGTTHAAIELSSHALDQRRCAGTLLDAAVITNITQDHFDYHGTWEHYRQSKMRILDYIKPAGLAIVNMDDPGSRSALDEAPRRLMTYGLSQPADVSGLILDSSLSGSHFRVVVGSQHAVMKTRLPGQHNVGNCLAAIAAATHLGINLDQIARGIESLQSVPGRLDPVDCDQPFHVFVDYAHTDDALQRCLTFLKSLTTGRLIVVFGAGGNRDRSKRKLMGQAAQLADLAVVTSDNPRTEDPQQIIRDILTGFGAGPQPLVEPDRELAIAMALQRARRGDCVLIAGKGHETEQIIGDRKIPFDDREVARRCLGQGSPLQEPHLFRRWARASRTKL